MKRAASRRGWRALAITLAIAALGCRRTTFPAAPVFLISIDTLRADRVPVYGYRGVETPALDALARDGVVFETAIAQVPLTLPSHASLFTGQQPFVNGVRDNLGYRLARGAKTLAAQLRSHGYSTGGAVSAIVLDRASGISEGFEFWDDAIEVKKAGQAIGQVQRPGLQTERRLEEWIAGAPSGKPLFGFLHLYEPHSPYEPPEPFASKYRGRPYDGEVASADAVVGKFISSLKAQGLYDGALVVLLSDHGEGLGDHGEDEHGIFLYAESIRVPLILKLPGGRDAGRRVSSPAGLVDVFPTVFAALGLEAPGGLAGIPLWPAGKDGAAPRRIYSETMFPRFHFGWSDLASLSDGRSHYIHAPRPELYDWTSDPGERRDLSAGLPDAFRSMRAALLALSRPLEPPGASDPETVKKLASLGYLGAGNVPSPGGALPDPKDRIGLVARLKEAGRLAEEGKADRAIGLLETLVRENPMMLDARQTLARTLREAGRTEEAYRALLEVDRMEPGTPPVLLALADLALEKRDLAAARMYAKAAEAAGSPDSALVLGSIALAAMQLPEARTHASAAMQAHPKSRAPFLLVARIELAAGNLAGALEALGRLRQVDPEAPPIEEASFLAGDALARLGRSGEARAAFLTEIRDFPANPRGYTGLALLEASEGRAAEAGRALHDLVERPSSADSLFLAARTYDILGDRAAGARARAEAARRFPGARERLTDGRR